MFVAGSLDTIASGKNLLSYVLDDQDDHSFVLYLNDTLPQFLYTSPPLPQKRHKLVMTLETDGATLSIDEFKTVNDTSQGLQGPRVNSAVVAIGASIGGAVLIVVALLLWFILHNRRKKRASGAYFIYHERLLFTSTSSILHHGSIATCLTIV